MLAVVALLGGSVQVLLQACAAAAAAAQAGVAWLSASAGPAVGQSVASAGQAAVAGVAASDRGLAAGATGLREFLQGAGHAAVVTLMWLRAVAWLIVASLRLLAAKLLVLAIALLVGARDQAAQLVLAFK